eukprot:5902169-Amphidinium_carterae.1
MQSDVEYLMFANRNIYHMRVFVPTVLQSEHMPTSLYVKGMVTKMSIPDAAVTVLLMLQDSGNKTHVRFLWRRCVLGFRPSLAGCNSRDNHLHSMAFRLASLFMSALTALTSLNARSWQPLIGVLLRLRWLA